MTKVKIYKPAKTAMQSGKANTEFWLLEYEPAQKEVVDNLIGWSGSGDMKREIRLKFDTREQAVAYAEKSGLEYTVTEPKKKKIRIQSYADNFVA